MTGKVSIFLISPTYEKLLSTAVITQGAVSQGMEVFIFLSFAQVAFKRGEVEKFSKLGKDYEEYKDAAVNYLTTKNVSWFTMLREAKKMGKVSIVACSLVADMLGLKKGDFDPTLVDDIAGVATFLSEAAESDVVLYI
ncbi:MAG: DsrE/DsrF/DrsH-like family protein [Acidilobus sp.]